MPQKHDIGFKKSAAGPSFPKKDRTRRKAERAQRAKERYERVERHFQAAQAKCRQEHGIGVFERGSAQRKGGAMQTP